MLKKIIFLLIIIFSLSACQTVDNKMLNEKTIKSKQTETNDFAKPVKPLVSNKIKENKQSVMTNSRTTINDKIELKDLAKEYTQAIIKTSLGDIKVKFYNNDSPLTVNNFLNLAQNDFYNKTKFHRIISDFMIQGGDPISKDDSKKALWGTGGPDYRFRDEFNSHPLVRGSLAMANAGPNTNGSQFFIVTKDATPWLDGKHTNFGEIVSGMDVVSKIEASKTDATDKPLKDIIINSIELIK